MKKQMRLKFIIGVLILCILAIKTQGTVFADWWQRSDVRPTQPSVPRTEIVFPTSVPNPTPTPTPKVTNPSVTPVPTGLGNTNNTGGSSSTEDPCAPGKSYVGPYCGWSPTAENNGGGNDLADPRIGGPAVKGLSYTGGGDLGYSDIILLVGVLCILLYIRSKITVKRLI